MPSVSGWALQGRITKVTGDETTVSMPSVSGWALQVSAIVISIASFITVSMPSVSGWALQATSSSG